MIALFSSAFLLGLLGSFHCAGMCGPIAISLPLPGDSIWQKIPGGLFYNTGRILTYGLMGLIFGLVGEGLHLVGFQQIVSVTMGIIMIIAVLFPGLFRITSNQSDSSFRPLTLLKKTIGRLFAVKSLQSLFFIGLLNGMLPCGLVYFAIAGAIAAGNIVTSTWYMIFFGLGTIPMLLAISITGNIISASARQKITKLIPILVIIVGLFFILRGLNLGIPYLSPTKEKIEKKFEKGLQGTSTFQVEVVGLGKSDSPA
jgi:uncharacterized protein